MSIADYTPSYSDRTYPYPYITHDREVGATYVYLSGAVITETRELDDHRMVDYAADGSAVGVEFLGVIRMPDLDGIPQREAIEPLLRAAGLISNE